MSKIDHPKPATVEAKSDTEIRPPGERRKSIVIVEDHLLFCQGLTSVINYEDDLTVIGTADDVESGLARVEELNPDLMIIDLTLKYDNGISLVKRLSADRPDLPILILSMHDEKIFSEQVIRAGAKGFVMKSEDTNTILRAIRQVLAGEYYLSDRMMQRIFG
ncbi:MAG: response regulator transcription factor [Candidatus Neomarinimicrobiota bacterium]